jgi:hypothetical protein
MKNQNGKEVTAMKKLLFETWLGDKMLALFERLTGLAVVPADRIAEQPAGKPSM